jgi:hypothetical protein
MSEKVKIAMIAGVVVLVAVWMILKNTPYNRCVDAIIDGTEHDQSYAEVWCAKNS